MTIVALNQVFNIINLISLAQLSLLLASINFLKLNNNKLEAVKKVSLNIGYNAIVIETTHLYSKNQMFQELFTQLIC